MNKTSLLAGAIVLITILNSCSKEAGPGGTSTITGVVMGSTYSAATAEVTEITLTSGVEVDHGDYWVLNTPGLTTDYYIWYDNEVWINDGDPYLAGRTGIAVPYVSGDSNVELTTKTFNAIQPVLATHFSFDGVVNDVLRLTCKTKGAVADASKMTSPFDFNIDDQGADEVIGVLQPAIDERVYIVYGDNTSYGETVRTGGDGEFTFSALKKGSYKVYVLSIDSTIGEDSFVKIEKAVEVTDNKMTVDAGTFEILY